MSYACDPFSCRLTFGSVDRWVHGVELAVTSREVVWLYSKWLRREFVPVLYRLQGRLAAEG